MNKRKGIWGFEPAFTWILDLLCYAYYVKHDSLVSDQTFDELEKLYCKIFDLETAPKRAMEREEQYGYGVKFVYDWIKRRGTNDSSNTSTNQTGSEAV